MNNGAVIPERWWQLRARRIKLERRCQAATTKNNGEAGELRREIAGIDQDIDALEEQVGSKGA